ncbi:CPBP family intramembrane glutamic endopeptidase [Ruminococcus sp. FC2018]|uniref:CPBP family intramembrane glutamic endopeptidase n=1 Tax=Ruminococcus sp. FC2018 TaxID=1410617 RepID=UPI00048C5467|nr:CPBP family intramembrane glutamic endopeptidase [Ruminococcus sp. FC2018]
MEIIQTTGNGVNRRMGRDCTVLGFLLLLYHFTAKLMGYAFYYASYAVMSKKFTLSWETIRQYFTDNYETYSSTSFQMTANISVTLATILVTLLTARLAFRVNVLSLVKPSSENAKTGVKWLPPCFVFNMVSSTIIAYITSVLNRVGVSVPTSDFSIHKPSVAAVLIQILYVVILAPIFEEIIYRGLIIKMLSPHSKTAAVLVSALAFGLMHGNIPQAASAFATGLVYAIIAVKCGSIVPTVIIHGLNNLIVNSTDLLAGLGIKNMNGVISLIEICIGLAGFLIWFTGYKYMKFETERDPAVRKASVQKVLTSPVLLIYLLLQVFYIIWGMISANS